MTYMAAEKTMGYSTAGIQRLFMEYVQNADGKPRHTKEANAELDNFSQFLSVALPTKTKLQNTLYERMMDCAVEFEESGFIAGFRYALSLTNDKLAALINGATQTAGSDPAKLHDSGGPAITDGNAAQQQEETGTANPVLPSSNSEEQSKKPYRRRKNPFAAGDIDTHIPFSLTSKQIGELFHKPQSKVVYQIEDQILPFLDESYKQNFRRCEGRTVQNKPHVFYRLDRTACEIYLKVMRERKQYINVVAGVEKMEELMKTVFPETA